MRRSSPCNWMTATVQNCSSSVNSSSIARFSTRSMPAGEASYCAAARRVWRARPVIAAAFAPLPTTSPVTKNPGVPGREDVVEVAADVGLDGARAVADRELDARDVGQRGGQQPLLEGLGDVAALGEQPRVVERE